MRLRFLAIGAATVAMAVAALAFAPRQGPSDQGAGGDDWMGYDHGGMMGGYYGAQLPPQLAFLRQVPPAQRFDFFRGATITFADQNGNPVVLKMTPGTVTSIGSNSITVTPNGSTTSQTYNITPNTVVRAPATRGTLQALSAGDKVVVVTVDQSNDAVIIMKHPTPRATPTVAPGAATPAPSPTVTPGGATATPVP